MAFGCRLHALPCLQCTVSGPSDTLFICCCPPPIPRVSPPLPFTTTLTQCMHAGTLWQWPARILLLRERGPANMFRIPRRQHHVPAVRMRLGSRCMYGRGLALVAITTGLLYPKLARTVKPLLTYPSQTVKPNCSPTLAYCSCFLYTDLQRNQ